VENEGSFQVEEHETVPLAPLNTSKKGKVVKFADDKEEEKKPADS